MRRFAPLVALIPAVAFGQPLTLEARPDAEEGLPASIRVFDVTRSGTSLRASLIRADLTADDWLLQAVLSDEGGETVPSFASDPGVFAAVNGGYFGSGQSFSLVLDRGVVASPNIRALNRGGTTFYPMRGAVGVSGSRQPDVAWVYDIEGVTYAYPTPTANAPGSPQPQPTATFPDGGAPWDVEVAIGGGPVLVQNGTVAITYDEEVMFGSGVDLTTARARTAVGYTSAGQLLLVAVSEANGLTLGALAQLLVDLGATEAVNLDGGGSSAMSSGGVPVVSSSRPVLSALRLVAPDGGGNENEFIFDTGDDTYRETGEWFESANAPFVGGTRSRLNEVGTGEDRAVFVFDDIGENDGLGYYFVEAWWTPSTNRAIDTPFIIYGGDVPDTLRVDQTSPNASGSWNYISSAFLSPGDSLVVTDDAIGAESPAFVCVDAIRLTPGTPPSTESGPTGPALHLSPNPVAHRLDVAVTPSRAGTVRVDLLDVLGRVVRTEAVVVSGEAGLGVDVRGLAPGLYLLRAVTEAGATTRAVTVVR
ncbi:MAG: phosphodiester glycosidase family protein [Bacteroidota bacterium]